MAKAIKLEMGETVYALYDVADEKFVYVVNWTELRHTTVPKASGMASSFEGAATKLQRYQDKINLRILENEDARARNHIDHNAYEPAYTEYLKAELERSTHFIIVKISVTEAVKPEEDLPSKRELAGLLVADYARYVEGSDFGQYKIALRGILFVDTCTASLADQVADAFNFNKLMKMTKTNLRNT